MKSERRLNDHYVTPDWAVRRFLELYAPPPFSGEAIRVLDPCAAKGELLTEAKRFFPDGLFCAGDINPAFEADLKEVTGGAVVIGDFLQSIPVWQACKLDFVVTNPPYALAEEFIHAALDVTPIVAMLLRINFLASKKRRNFLKAENPGVFVLPNRPTFDGEGNDMTEYAWFVFGDERVAGRIDYCALTPIEEIRAAKQRAREIHSAEVAA